MRLLFDMKPVLKRNFKTFLIYKSRLYILILKFFKIDSP